MLCTEEKMLCDGSSVGFSSDGKSPDYAGIVRPESEVDIFVSRTDDGCESKFDSDHL